ncbi:MAG: E3 binding domain-containing protein, partial [Chloroflexi bacterium]|nr:E3 binding domain-containing protein [Chloroflexota bacterium]
MATNVLLPQWGMNMEEGLLVKWLVKEGDAVEAGQPLVEVETAKINSELEAPVSGVVAHIMAGEGETVKVGELVVVIAAPGEQVARPASSVFQRQRAAATTEAGRAARPQQAGRVQVTPIARRLARDNDINLDEVVGTGPNGRITEMDVIAAIGARKPARQAPRVEVVPRARLLAKEQGIDLVQVQGTGPNGRILVADVEKAVSAKSAAPAGEVIRLR